MDWGAVVWIVLGVVGAGLVAGGVVVYRGSATTGVRALSAVSIAAGIAMWTVIAFTVSVSTSTENEAPAPHPDASGLAGYVPLLAAEDVVRVSGGGVSLSTDVRDMKEMAANVDPAQVVNMYSWYGVTFESQDQFKGLVFSVIDFNSSRAAQDHFGRVISETPGLAIMEVPIGDISANVEINMQGFGSILVFRVADTFVSLHTTQPQGLEPLMSLEGLAVLAREVQERGAE